MEMEYVGPKRRGRVIVIIGVILAAIAGGGAFVVVNNAQQQATEAAIPKVTVVVAAQAIPARKTIDQGDIAVHQIPADAIPPGSAITDPTAAIGHIAAISILPGQPISTNMFAASTGNGTIAVLNPDESVTPDSPAWRAVALNVPDDRALGGLLAAGQNVDVFVTVPVNVSPTVTDNTTAANANAGSTNDYIADKSTKVTYQDVPIIAKNNTYYIVRVTQQVAEEISHLQASGSASFSFALRPDIDTRITNTAGLGETTNLLIQRYGLPVPEAYPNAQSKVNNPAPGTPAPLPYLAVSSPAPTP